MMSKKDEEQQGAIEIRSKVPAKAAGRLHLVKSDEVAEDDLMRNLKTLGKQILDEPLPARLLDALRKSPPKGN